MNKADLLAGLKKQPVSVEVNGVKLYLKPLTVGQKEAFAVWRKDNPGGRGVLGRLIAASLCDESGAPILDTPEEADDLDGGIVEAICSRILDLNGMGAPEPGKASAPTGPN